MSKVQVIVEKDERRWDAIRDTEELAFMRVADHMEKSHLSGIAQMGNAIHWKRLFGKPVKEFLESQGFKVTIKQIEV